MRYFFHAANGERVEDTIGTEFPSQDAAKVGAIRLAGEVIKDAPRMLRGPDARDFRIELTDSTNMLLFTVFVVAVDAPA